VNVRRGGIAFAGGWCAPSDAIYNLIGPSKPLTKKELRERVKYLEKTLERERKRARKAERKAAKRIAALQRVIERIG
jgi:hypothetical protein